MLFLDFIIRSLRLKICKKQCGLVCLAGCVCIQTQEMIAHVVMDSYQACLIGCCYRNIDLCVISIAVIQMLCCVFWKCDPRAAGSLKTRVGRVRIPVEHHI